MQNLRRIQVPSRQEDLRLKGLILTISFFFRSLFLTLLMSCEKFLGNPPFGEYSYFRPPKSIYNFGAPARVTPDEKIGRAVAELDSLPNSRTARTRAARKPMNETWARPGKAAWWPEVTLHHKR